MPLLSPKLLKLLKRGVLAAIVGFGLLQLFPVKRFFGIPTEDIGTNPPERFAFDGPPEVERIMRRACFDCHTNETRWPLYARVAPRPGCMARERPQRPRPPQLLQVGRLRTRTSARPTARTACEQIESGAMPPWFYVLPMHPDAKLSPEDKTLLRFYLMGKSKPKVGPMTSPRRAERSASDARSTPNASVVEGAKPRASDNRNRTRHETCIEKKPQLSPGFRCKETDLNPDGC